MAAGDRATGRRGMRFRILGPMDISGPGGPIVIASNRQQIILMMILLEPNRAVPVDRLIEAVWDESPPSTARGQVQICVSMLRRLFADAGIPELITTSPSGYLARVPGDELDLQVFQDGRRGARRAADEGRYAEADEKYHDALGLWRGSGLTTA